MRSLGHRCGRQSVAAVATVGGRRIGGRDLSGPTDDVAGVRRGIALGHGGRRDDRQRRLDCAPSARAGFCRASATGKLGDGGGRNGSRRGRSGGDSPAKCPGHHAGGGADLRLMPGCFSPNGGDGGRTGLCHGRAGAADRPAGRIRSAVHPAGGRVAVGLARRLHARPGRGWRCGAPATGWPHWRHWSRVRRLRFISSRSRSSFSSGSASGNGSSRGNIWRAS